MQSFLDLGFHFKPADLEGGHLYGVHQKLPFYQEIEFYPPAQQRGLVGEVELTFVAGPAGLEVILEADKRAGRCSGDAIGRFSISHDDAMRTDWPSEIDRWLSGLTAYGHGGYGHGGGFGGHHDGHHDPHHGDPYGHAPLHGHHDPHYGHQDPHHGHHAHQEHRSGPGWGAVAAAGAAGVVGGLVAGEIVEEIFEDDDEGGEESDW
ncbi:sporulation protein [Nonomuraea sp. NPDC050227]|uniref:sporulation protein n=1 Tax=Nonomuraea sp. NPDC050227 TaxID=3364360 RepID=UPI00379BF724